MRNTLISLWEILRFNGKCKKTLEGNSLLVGASGALMRFHAFYHLFSMRLQQTCSKSSTLPFFVDQLLRYIRSRITI